MKIKRVLISFLGLLLAQNMVLAENNKSPMEKYLSKLAILDSQDGKTLETFEDVNVNLDPYQERNKPYPIVNEEEIPEGYVNKSTAQKYFKSFLAHAVLIDEEMEFKDFFNEHFYLNKAMNIATDDNTTDNEEEITNHPGDYINSAEFEENIEPLALKGFPTDYNVTAPGTNTFYLCMDSNYRYVEKFKEFKPDALSCRSCKSLCGKSCAKGHVYGPNNIYSEFKNHLLDEATIVDAEEISNPDNSINIIAQDRTPPVINLDFLPNDALSPDTTVCTTGDYYKMPSVEVTDNYCKTLYAKFAFGRINKCPENGELWQDLEKWDYPEKIYKVGGVEFNQYEDGKETGKKYLKNCFNDVVYFNPFVGIVNFCVFAKEGSPDGKGNLNPSCFNIVQDHPEISYGYSENIDLGNTPSTAKEWIDKRELGDIRDEGKDKRTVNVYDNDRPNIIIRITNVKTGSQMFFPPCVASSEAKISNSSLYKTLNGRTNEDEYKLFVENLGPDYNYKAIIAAPLFKPPYTVFSVDDKTIKTETEKENNYVYRTILNNDLEFINFNVRVEDYFCSDTNIDGSKTYVHKPGLVGKRNGTFTKMVALWENSGEFYIKSNVEYKLDVWVDDNVKWCNVEDCLKWTQHKAEVVSGANVFHTGVKSGVIRLDVPNDNDGESLSQEQKVDITKNINGDIYFTLKKSTPRVYDFTTPEEIEENHFPSISVELEDFSGLYRSLKLYFRVDDRNLNVRVLEEKKKKKKK